MMPMLIIAVLAYLLGSIPFGLIFTKMAGLGDIRTIGSGNIGATNVLRTGNKKIAILTLIFDGCKGIAAVLLAHAVTPGTEQVAALAVVIGHTYPVWLKFKGGKGVVTTAGIALALAWPVGLTMIATWTAILKITRVSSLAGLIGIGLLPIYAFLYGYREIIPVLLMIVALVFFKHSDNIKRLIQGTEPKVGASS